MDDAVRHIAGTYAPKGNYIGILMLASLFVEANATTFVIVFPVVGLLAAIFLLREVYGFQLD